MDGRWLNDDILVHVFAHLTVQEAAQYALTVCKKWRGVALFENHRRLRPETFEALKASATSRQSPLFRFSMLFERNLLKDAGFNEYPFAHKPPPPPSEIGWQMTKAGCFVVCDETVPLEDNKRWYDCRGHLQAHDIGVLEVPDGQSYREITQIVHLEKVLGHCGFSKAEGEKFLDLCLTFEAECEVTVVDTVPRGAENGWDMTVALDDGTPLTAPYQNSTRTAFTREALHVQRFRETPVNGETIAICRRVDHYPVGVRRAILSIGFTDVLAAFIRAPRLSFSLDAATEQP